MKYDLVLGMLDCFDLGVWIRFDFVLGFLFENVASQFYLLFFLIVFYSFFLFFWVMRRQKTYFSFFCCYEKTGEDTYLLDATGSELHAKKIFRRYYCGM